jgi:hypothetical protein
MPTKVVNLKREPYQVYIGRSGHGEDGTFGNPIIVGEMCEVCKERHYSPGETIPCFKRYFLMRIMADPTFRARVEKLRGKKLGCFCKPRACHGDVIVEYLEGMKR